MLFMDAYIGENICVFDETGDYLYAGCKCGDNEFLVKESYVNPRLVGAIFYMKKNAPVARQLW